MRKLLLAAALLGKDQEWSPLSPHSDHATGRGQQRDRGGGDGPGRRGGAPLRGDGDADRGCRTPAWAERLPGKDIDLSAASRPRRLWSDEETLWAAD